MMMDKILFVHQNSSFSMFFELGVFLDYRLIDFVDNKNRPMISKRTSFFSFLLELVTLWLVQSDGNPDVRPVNQRSRTFDVNQKVRVDGKTSRGLSEANPESVE